VRLQVLSPVSGERADRCDRTRSANEPADYPSPTSRRGLGVSRNGACSAEISKRCAIRANHLQSPRTSEFLSLAHPIASRLLSGNSVAIPSIATTPPRDELVGLITGTIGARARTAQRTMSIMTATWLDPQKRPADRAIVDLKRATLNPVILASAILHRAKNPNVPMSHLYAPSPAPRPSMRYGTGWELSHALSRGLDFSGGSVFNRGGTLPLALD